jgi:hypothetical protein
VKIVSIAILMPVFMFGQAPKPVEKPPVISTVLLKNFYAADSQQQRAQRQLEQAQQALQTASQSWRQAVDAMQKVCGEKFQLAQDSVTSDPVCKAKAAVVAPKPAEKK